MAALSWLMKGRAALGKRQARQSDSQPPIRNPRAAPNVVHTVSVPVAQSENPSSCRGRSYIQPCGRQIELGGLTGANTEHRIGGDGPKWAAGGLQNSTGTLLRAACNSLGKYFVRTDSSEPALTHVHASPNCGPIEH